MTFDAGSASPKLRFVATALAFGCVYFVAAALTDFLVEERAIAVVWPASGVYLGVMLAAPRRLWPALACGAALGAFGAYVHVGSSIQLAIGLAVPSAAEGLLGAVLVERIAGRRISLGGLNDVHALVVGAGVATALVGLSAGAVAAQTFDTSFVDSWLRWCSADALGVLGIAPLVLALRSSGRRRLSRAQLLYMAFVAAATVAAVSFDPSAVATVIAGGLAFPVLLWAGWRWGPRAVAFGGAGVALAATGLAATGVDLGGSAGARAYAVQAFLAVLLLGSLVFAAAVGDARRGQADAGNARRRLRHATDAAPGAYLAVDAEGRVTDWSRGAERMLGWHAKQALGRSLEETIAPGAGPATATTREIVLLARHRDGDKFPVELTMRPEPEAGEGLCHVFIRDLSENERIRDELRRAGAELEQRRLTGDERIEQLRTELASRGEELAGARRREERLAEDLRRSEAAGRRGDQDLGAAKRGLAATEEELARRGRQLDGAASDLTRARERTRALEAELERLRAQRERAAAELAEAVSGRRSAVRELTEERDRLERSLDDAAATMAGVEAERRVMSDHVTELVSRYDERGVCLYVSSASRTLLGYEPDELVGRPGAELLHPDDRARLLRARAAGTDSSFEARLRRRDGDFIWVEVTLHPVLGGDDGRLVELTTTVRDISERRASDDARRAAEARFRSLFATMPTASALLDAGGRLELANLALCRLTGHSRDQLEGGRLAAVVRDEDAAELNDGVRRVASGQDPAAGLTLRLAHASGRTVPARIVITPLPTGELVVHFRDTSEPNGTRDNTHRFSGELLPHVRG